MKKLFVVLILFSGICVSCEYDIYYYPKLKYPKKFNAVVYSDETVVLRFSGFSKNSGSLLVAFDAGKEEVVGQYWFPYLYDENCDNPNFPKRRDFLLDLGHLVQKGSTIYLNPSNQYYGDVISIDMITGEVFKFSHYNKNANYFEIINGSIYTESLFWTDYLPEDYDEYKVRITNLASREYHDSRLDFLLHLSTLFVNNSVSYIESEGKIYNLSTDRVIDMASYLEGESLVLPINTATGEIHYFIDRHFYGDETLCQIENVEPLMVSKKINISEQSNTEPVYYNSVIVLEQNDRLVIEQSVENLTFAADRSEDVKQFLIYDTETNQIIESISLNNEQNTIGGSEISYMTGALWWVSSENQNDDHLHVVKFNPYTYELSKIEFDRKL